MTAVALRSSSAAPASTMGPIRQTYATAETFPPVARAYTQVSQVAKELGLLRRAPVFYSLVGAALVLALAGCIAGFVLLGHSWFQLLIAAALGVVLTQVAFLAHEAANYQVEHHLFPSMARPHLSRRPRGARPVRLPHGGALPPRLTADIGPRRGGIVRRVRRCASQRA